LNITTGIATLCRNADHQWSNKRTCFVYSRYVFPPTRRC